VADKEPPVDRRQARVDTVRRQRADHHRPDQDRSGDDEVEHRLDDQRRRERRVARVLDPVLDEVELDDVAAAGGHDRVDADPGDVGAERERSFSLEPGYAARMIARQA
jgi:hypothetical protein